MLKEDSGLKTKCVVLEKVTIPIIEKIAKEQHRNFSGQIRHIVSLYLEKQNLS